LGCFNKMAVSQQPVQLSTKGLKILTPQLSSSVFATSVPSIAPYWNLIFLPSCTFIGSIQRAVDAIRPLQTSYSHAMVYPLGVQDIPDPREGIGVPAGKPSPNITPPSLIDNDLA
jgi:hypothetical protein